MAEKVEKVEKVEKEKRHTVASSLTPEQYEALEEFRWTNRIQTKGQVLSMALDKMLGLS